MSSISPQPSIFRTLQIGILLLMTLAFIARSHAQVIWNTGSLSFVKTAPGQMDQITQQTALTRNTVLFNAVCENVGGNQGCDYTGPCNTEWAIGTIEDWSTYTYTNWLNAQPTPCTPPSMIGVPMVCHLIAENIYLQITFTSWQSGGGGNFSYSRTTGPSETMELQARAFLDGPFVSAAGLMSDGLRNAGLIPASQPYGSAPWSYSGTETVAPAVLTVTGNNAIVDWVLLEIRSAAVPSTIVARRAALIQRDGDIVALNGTGPVQIIGIPAGTYRLAVRHRNHLGVMDTRNIWQSPIPAVIDLTSPSTQTFGTNARRTNGAVMTMWGGNANSNANVRYAGLANDRLVISNAVGASTPTNTVSNTYHNADLNMNGNVRYAGLANDRLYLSNVIGASTPTATITQQLP